MNSEIKPPLWILLELTHKCPLECAYCYNQLDFINTKVRDYILSEIWKQLIGGSNSYDIDKDIELYQSSEKYNL